MYFLLESQELDISIPVASHFHQFLWLKNAEHTYVKPPTIFWLIMITSDHFPQNSQPQKPWLEKM